MVNFLLGKQAVRLWTKNDCFRTAFSGGTPELAVDKREIWQIVTGQTSRSSQEGMLSQSWMFSSLWFHQYEDPFYHFGGRKFQCSHHPENLHANSQVWSFRVN